MKHLKCSDAESVINEFCLKEFVKGHDKTCVFSLRDQIKNISKITNNIANLPEDRNQPLDLELLLTTKPLVKTLI